MNVKNCRKCGKVFNYIGGMPICPQCREELEKKFDTVKEYIIEVLRSLKFQKNVKLKRHKSVSG